MLVYGGGIKFQSTLHRRKCKQNQSKIMFPKTKSEVVGCIAFLIFFFVLLPIGGSEQFADYILNALKQ